MQYIRLAFLPSPGQTTSEALEAADIPHGGVRSEGYLRPLLDSAHLIPQSNEHQQNRPMMSSAATQVQTWSSPALRDRGLRSSNANLCHRTGTMSSIIPSLYISRSQ
jgi:hypothetical protein